MIIERREITFYDILAVVVLVFAFPFFYFEVADTGSGSIGEYWQG